MSKTWTGERLEPSIWGDVTIEHLHRYAIVIEFIRGKIVLDIASGEGYGSNLMSKYAEKVIGVDIDENSISAAKNKYISGNLEFKVGTVDQIPLENNSVDVVVSFETLEHHDKHNEMMIEIKRVLRTNGIMIMSTPNKKCYSDDRNYQNPFHVKELYIDQFENLITSHFKNAWFFFQSTFKGSLILPQQKKEEFLNFSGDFDGVKADEGIIPKYCISISCDQDIPMHLGMTGFDGQQILLKVQETLLLQLANDKNRAVMQVRNSWSFRIGRFLLSPVRFFKKMT